MDPPPLDFVDWYRAEYPRLYATTVLIARDRSVAEDAVAEAFARALERWPRVRAMTSPGGWTCRVALNLIRRHHRGRTAGDLAGSAASDERLLPQTPELAVDLVAALDGLSPRSRTAFVLRFVQDLSEADVARAMGIKRGTVAALVHQAKVQLRLTLADHAPRKGVADASR